MRLIQYRAETGGTAVGRVSDDGTQVAPLQGLQTMHALAVAALAEGDGLDAAVSRRVGTATLETAALHAAGRLLPPLTHPEPARCLVSGTGLTHLGSAAARDAMHQKAVAADAAGAPLSDSMKMFRDGVAGGRPPQGQPGAQPEWFYKGRGDIVVGCGQALPSPAFALDGGEEPEIVGLYLIADDGTPCRLGFALGNEFSDHVTERQNYLLLAHSKLRACAIGPELRTGPLPADLRGSSRIRRGGEIIWEKPFLTGEANMSHTIANLEYHHFKYAAHRRPGDVHMHFFGTATLSFADGIRTQPGDRFEIELPAFGAPLVNPLAALPAAFGPGGVRAL